MTLYECFLFLELYYRQIEKKIVEKYEVIIEEKNTLVLLLYFCVYLFNKKFTGNSRLRIFQRFLIFCHMEICGMNSLNLT